MSQAAPAGIKRRLKWRLFRQARALQNGLTGWTAQFQLQRPLELLRHPEWTYRATRRLEIPPLVFPPIDQTQSDDEILCGRLIRAYERMRELDPPGAASPLWTENLDVRMAGLRDPVQRGDPAALAAALGSMFRQPFMYGISSADLYSYDVTAQYWPLFIVDRLVSLGEAVGVARPDVPEQGPIGEGFGKSLEQLVERIEKTTGIPFDAPRVGGAYGIDVAGRLVTPESPEHLYAALRLERAMSLHLRQEASRSPDIVEIGAGFGGTARWLLAGRSREIGSYTIVDLPLTCILQGYFLAKTLGQDAVSLEGEPAGRARVRIRSTSWIMREGARARVNVLVNENSMPEMTREVVESYIDWASGRVDGIFYSYNHESVGDHPTHQQVAVPEVAGARSRLRRLSRDVSWLRRGYVEEVYRVGDDGA